MRSFALALVLAASPTALADNGTALTQLTFAPSPDGKPIDVWLTRVLDGEGGLTIKVIARGVGAKAQALTVYTGGGGDEGPGENDTKAIAAHEFELPDGRKAVRVDFTYQVPESKAREIQTDTWLVGFGGGKTHKLLPEPLRTRHSLDRSKVCREREETVLTGEREGGAIVLVARRTQQVDAVYGEDDLPVDKDCRAPSGVERKTYKLALGEAAPAVEKSPETPPADAKPADVKPTDAKPSEAKPSEAKPAETKPTEAKPSETKPADGKAADKAPSKPADKAPSKPAPPPAEDDND